MKKRKICIVITARPSYSRVKTVLEAIKSHPKLELQLVVAASALLDRYGTTINYIEEDGFDVIAKVFNVIEGDSLSSASKTTGIGIIDLSTVFDSIRPDIVLTIADRFETIATAISACYRNTPLAHIQGGEVTGNIDEKVRHAITKLSDYHFVASEDARERVIRMGEKESCVYNTGCPSIDLAKRILNNPSIDFDPFNKYSGVGNKFDVLNDYIVILQHPVTTEYDLSQQNILKTLNVVKNIGLPAYWFWPNLDVGSDGTSKGIRLFREENTESKIYFLKNMEPSDFLRLILNSKVLIGNSSVGIRECSYLGIPVVNLGNRQHRRQRGENVIDVDFFEKDITKAIKKQLAHGHYKSNEIYGSGESGLTIADILYKVKLSFHKTISY